MKRGHSFSPDGMQSFPYSVGGGKLAYGDCISINLHNQASLPPKASLWGGGSETRLWRLCGIQFWRLPSPRGRQGSARDFWVKSQGLGMKCK